jgi:hypothetical protein
MPTPIDILDASLCDPLPDHGGNAQRRAFFLPLSISEMLSVFVHRSGLTLYVERVEWSDRSAFGISAQGFFARAFQERRQLGEPAELIGQRPQIAGCKVIALGREMAPAFGQYLHDARHGHQERIPPLLGGETG